MQPKKDEVSQVTEAARAQAELTAQTVVARLQDAAKDREKVAEIVEVWGDEIDRVIGRAVRKALLFIGSALTLAIAAKMGMFEKIGGWFK